MLKKTPDGVERLLLLTHPRLFARQIALRNKSLKVL